MQKTLYNYGWDINAINKLHSQTYVYLWLICVDVWQRPTQYLKEFLGLEKKMKTSKSLGLEKEDNTSRALAEPPDFGDDKTEPYVPPQNSRQIASA